MPTPTDDTEGLERLAALVRLWIIESTNRAGSGHPTSSLSAVELMVALFFGGFFRYDPGEPDHPNNDRLIFSKGHASPLFYALWTAAGAIPAEELDTYRELGSRLEGHPSMAFPYTEAPTGSLGQGLSVGVGMALTARFLDGLPYRTWVLLGDSEMTEGSQWEAIQLAGHLGLDGLTGVLDVNRLGQRGPTMPGHDLATYARRVEAFGWEAVVVEDGHDPTAVLEAYGRATAVEGRPAMVIARTVKGRGVPSVEDRNGHHGQALGDEALAEALAQMRARGLEPDRDLRGELRRPEDRRLTRPVGRPAPSIVPPEKEAATRDGYGEALVRLRDSLPDLVVLDGEVGNSTRADRFRDACPERFFEMYVAEQNMVGVALGLARRGRLPFVSTFAAFLTRAFDQLRMAAYAEVHLVVAGSHAGTSIGRDGPSQMGLEDLAMFRCLPGATVLYPADAVAAERLVELAAGLPGIVYLRLTRGKTPTLYGADADFRLGGSHTLAASAADAATIVSAGYTLHEALAAAETLAREDGLAVRVIDCYSVEPLDRETLERAARETGHVLVVEDHRAAGGLGEAVFAALAGLGAAFAHLAVDGRPGSGPTPAMLAAQGLDRQAIAERVRRLVPRG